MNDPRIRPVSRSRAPRLALVAAALALPALLLWPARDERPAEPPTAPLAAAPRGDLADGLPALEASSSEMPLFLDAGAGLSTLPRPPESATGAAPQAAAPAAEETRDLDVVVVDANGRPVAGARIAVFGELIELLKDFTHVLRSRGREPTPAGFEKFQLGVRVEDTDPAWEEPISTWTSAADGSARLKVPTAVALLVATHPEAGSSGVVTVPARDEMEEDEPGPWTRLVLSPRGTLKGVVRDRAGRPAPGARVIFPLMNFFDDGRRSRVPLPIVTDALGGFRVEVDTPYVTALHAERDELVTPAVPAYVRPGAESEVELRFPGDFAITGIVLSPGGSAVPGARVDVAGWQLPVDKVNTDERGRFRLELNAASHVVLVSEAEGLVPAEGVPATLTDTQPVADVVLRLIEPATISGRIQWADGSPSPGQVVTAQVPLPAFDSLSDEERLTALSSTSMDGMAFTSSLADTAHSEADGRFVLTGIHPGHAVDLTCTGFPGQTTGEVTVKRVAPGSRDVLLVLEHLIEGSNRLGGRVVDGDTGAPVPLYVLQWVPWEYGLAPFGRSMRSVDDPAARFEIGDLDSGKPLRLIVEAVGYPMHDFGPFTPAADADLELHLGHHASLAILVRDEAGAAQPGAHVQLMRGGASGSDALTETMSRDTGRDGRLAWPDLKPGEYSIEAALGALRAKRQRVELSSGRELRVELTLQPPAGTGELEILALRADGAPWAAANVEAVLAVQDRTATPSLDPVYLGVTDDTGRLHLGGLQPGTYIVYVACVGVLMPLHRVDVAADGTAHLTVSAPK